MKRKEFSQKTRGLAFLRCGGLCESCGMKLKVSEGEYDHVIPYALSEDSSLENCQVLCIKCHRGVGSKTSNDVRTIAKVKRIEAKHRGTKEKKPWSPFKKKMNGQVVDRKTGKEIGK